MRKDDFPEFSTLLDDAYSFQTNKLSANAKAVFFRAMAPYSLPAIRAAINAHLLDPKVGKFAIQPADVIAQLQGMAGNDGRPGAEEAWAIALSSQDEAATVVWTQEIAEAFGICSTVLQAGDEVGARMAFKEAYQRLVAGARSNGQLAQWSASLGWDIERRTEVLTKAATGGLLPAPTVAALLPPPEPKATDDSHAKEQLARIKQMLAGMGGEKDRERELHDQREREATAAAKADIAAQVDGYQRRVA